MTAPVVILMVYGFLSMALDAVLWGCTGYLLFRLAGGTDRRWWVGALLLWVVYFLVEELLVGFIGHVGAFRTDDPDVADLIGSDLFAVDATDVVFSLVICVGGFLLGRLLLRRFAAGAAATTASRPGPMPPPLPAPPAGGGPGPFPGRE